MFLNKKNREKYPVFCFIGKINKFVLNDSTYNT